MRFLLLLLLLPGIAQADLAAGYQFFDVRSGEPLTIGPVNTHTVTGFEIFYATPGSGDISEIAGHLLLRIKLSGPQDLVVSFLADTEAGKTPAAGPPLPVQENCRKRNWYNLVRTPDPAGESPLSSIGQSLKGLAGGFEVVMDVQTLEYILKSYTVEQDRNLWRYELLLTDDMKRNLLSHLEQIQHQAGPPYYFFSQNCGSVLVQVLGEGIGNQEVASFHPWVSPPHSLVALLIRNGLARPTAPHFHSFRQRGMMFRQRFKYHYEALIHTAPHRHWPPVSDFFSVEESRRIDAVYSLAARHADAEDLELLGSLIQEMEMAFDDKDRACRDYTSGATAAAREMQASLRQTTRLPVQGMQQELMQVPAYHALHSGTDHTGLFVVTPGAALWNGHAGGSLEVSLLKQEMGSSSRIAMQRAGAVELGGFDGAADGNGIREWQITGLKLEKFRESLGRVPSCFQSTRGWGLGLGVLQAEHRELSPDTRLRWGSIGILGNIISSANHDNFLFTSWGLDFSRVHRHGFEFPLGMQSLVTAGNIQWRSRAEFLASTISGIEHEVQAESGLTVRLGEWRGSEYRVKFSGDYQLVLDHPQRDRWRGKMGVEIRRW